MNFTAKRKEVSLEAETLALLELQAQLDGRSLKNYMEHILRRKANDFELSETYKKEMDVLLAKHAQGKNKYIDKKSFIAQVKKAK